MNYEFFLEITKKTSGNYIKEVIVIADEELSLGFSCIKHNLFPHYLCG